jgi:hypothetical protein
VQVQFARILYATDAHLSLSITSLPLTKKNQKVDGNWRLKREQKAIFGVFGSVPASGTSCANHASAASAQ